MSMNGVDYSKRLAKEREYFQEANKKLKAATDKRIEDTEKHADHVTTKQRENFIEDRADLEKNYQANLDNLKEKVRDSLDDSSSKFNRDMENERRAFTQDSLKKSRDFDQRLSDIKSSYQKAFNSEKNNHEELTNFNKDKYNKSVGEIRNKSDKQMQDYQDRMAGAGSEMKDQYNQERAQLVRAQEDRLTEAFTDAAKKRAEQKDRIDNENKKLRDVHGAEKDQLRQYTSDRLSNIQNQFDERTEALAKDYSQRNANLAKSESVQAIKTNREQQDKIAEIRRGYNDTVRRMELDRRRRDNGSGEFADVQKKQQGLKDQIIHDNKVKHLKDEIVDHQRNYQARAENEQGQFNETLKEQSVEAAARQERKLNEANADKLVTVSKEREKSEREIQNREHQNLLDKTAYEAQLMNERNNAEGRIAKLKENFNSSMQTLDEKHKASLEDVTKTANMDKNEFMKQIQERRADEIHEMKRTFGKMMDSTVQNYEQRLATFQRENEYIKLSLTQKLETLMDQTEKQLVSQKTLFDDRRDADIKGQQILMDQREAQLKKNFTEMNISYQKKIDKMQMDNDTKFKLMTNDYESKLKEQKALSSKEIAAKDTDHQAQLARVKQAYEDERTRIVNSYETQIESMKLGHEEKMRQMADFKRLS